MPRLKKIDKPLMAACEEGDVDAARSALEGGANPNCHGLSNQTPLVCAIEEEHEDVVDLLLSQDAIDVDALGSYGSSPLEKSAQRGNRVLFNRLLDRGAVVTSSSELGGAVLRAAAHNCGLAEVTRVLKLGVPVDTPIAFGKTLLHEAAESNPELIDLLLEQGADVDARSDAQQTPLHCAAHYGRADIAKRLLDQGADIDAADKDGATPLFAAIHPTCFEPSERWKNCGAFVELLIARGADVNATVKTGGTLLMHASWTDVVDAMNALMAAGAAIDAKDKQGETAFLKTAICPALGAAKVLLAAGASIEVRNELGWTTLDLALSQQGSAGTNPAEMGVKGQMLALIGDSHKDDKPSKYSEYISWLIEAGCRRATQDASG